MMPLVIAEDTEVKIKTAPDVEVQMGVYISGSEFNSDSLIESYTGNSDQYGDIEYDFEIERDEFNLMVFVRREGEDTIMKKYLDETSGELVYYEIDSNGIELTPTPGFENGVAIVEEGIEAINETVNETGIVNETEEEASKIVGKVFSVFGDEGVLSKKRIYYIGGFLFLVHLG